MITEAVANWFLSAVAWLINLLPALPASTSSSIASFQGNFDEVVAVVAKLSPVVPFSDIAVSAGILAAFWVFAILLQGGRIVLSFVTLGGGSV